MENILAIDDNETMLESLNAYLTRIGYCVASAKNGKEAIEIFSKGHRFDLVITDIDMPFMDGNAVALHIRHSERAEVPIFAITGNRGQHIDRKLFNFVLRKPFQFDTLANLIRDYL